MQSTTNTNTSLANHWKLCRCVGYLNSIFFATFGAIMAMALIAYLFYSFFKQLSIEEKKERLCGLHPIAIILYLIMSFVLFRANWEITTKDMPRYGNILNEWLLRHQIVFVVHFIYLIILLCFYESYYYCVFDFITLAILLIEISIVKRFYKKLTWTDHDMVVAMNMHNVL
ncbi:uncharacterized protein LOC114128254 [Aphis gossypii]|uniref:uncharacterized protein LOC114128254 n=1 Tax=Aphis gossypii TaxID=80765 RepID=UPI00215982C6|nr:uncharacterized protein LOC114128254 [Aphis gossypii]